ncbi:MAG: hypothetical protein QOD66_1563 [Solirubrobacteraceae bacterium]|jgi:predicted short-subunit dehydrogenase-like oxidoreductase (DUF2520 family)|nr:hypothetical protein [Solirubrobacteraceae bacterium]
MRELEREPSSDIPACTRLALVGRGRLGTALAQALAAAGVDVAGPLARGADGANADAVLLCVPDGEIARAASLISPGRLVGHCSGASRLDVLAPHEAFSLHPLMTVTRAGANFDGAGAAIAGTTLTALRFAAELATRLGMRSVQVAEADRALYHAAASMASNFLVTVEAAAERLMGRAGVERALLVPLVRATVENWAGAGAEQALTGPVARGDEATVQAQRAAISAREPELLSLFDSLVSATRQLSHGPDATPAIDARQRQPA